MEAFPSRPSRDSGGYFYFVLDPQDFLEPYGAQAVPTRDHNHPPPDQRHHHKSVPSHNTSGHTHPTAAVLKFGPRPTNESRHRVAASLANVPYPLHAPAAAAAWQAHTADEQRPRRNNPLEQQVHAERHQLESPRMMAAAYEELPVEHHAYDPRHGAAVSTTSGARVCNTHPSLARAASPRVLASVPMAVKSPSPVAPKRVAPSSSSATTGQPQPQQRTTSPSPELSVGITESSPPRYVPHVTPESQKMDAAVQRRRVAELQRAGLLNSNRSTQHALHDGSDAEACPTEDDGGKPSTSADPAPPRWVVLHHMAEVLHSKRQAAIEAHDEATAVALEQEIVAMRRSQEALRLRTRTLKQQPPTATVPRSMSPASAQRRPQDSECGNEAPSCSYDASMADGVGAVDRPPSSSTVRTVRSVLPELVPVMEAKAYATTLLPRQHWHQPHEDGSESHVAGDTEDTVQPAAVSRCTSDSSDSPPRAQRTVPSPSPSPRQQRRPKGAENDTESPSCEADNSDAGVTTAHPPRFQRASYQEESHSFHPKITRGPKQVYYEKHYGHLVASAVSSSGACGADATVDHHNVPTSASPNMGLSEETRVEDEEEELPVPGNETAPRQAEAVAPSLLTEVLEVPEEGVAPRQPTQLSAVADANPNENRRASPPTEATADDGERSEEEGSADVEAILREGEQALRELEAVQGTTDTSAQGATAAPHTAAVAAQDVDRALEPLEDTTDAAQTMPPFLPNAEGGGTLGGSSSSTIALPRVAQQRKASAVPTRRHHIADDDLIPDYSSLQDPTVGGDAMLPSMEPTPRAFDDDDDGHTELHDLFSRGTGVGNSSALRIAALRD